MASSHFWSGASGAASRGWRQPPGLSRGCRTSGSGVSSCWRVCSGARVGAAPIPRERSACWRAGVSWSCVSKPLPSSALLPSAWTFSSAAIRGGPRSHGNFASRSTLATPQECGCQRRGFALALARGGALSPTTGRGSAFISCKWGVAPTAASYGSQTTLCFAPRRGGVALGGSVASQMGKELSPL